MMRTHEQGFALISAVWLLTLAASIAALLMLLSLRQNRELKATEAETDAGRDLDSVVAQVSAAILFEGAAGKWGHIPARGEVMLGRRSMAVAIEREDMRLDPNKAPLSAIDDLLHDKGYPPEQRAAILARIAQARSAHRPIGTFSDVLALGHDVLPRGHEACLADLISPFGGMQADNQPAGISTGDGSPVRVGDTLRLAVGDVTRRQTAAVRILGMRAEPYSVLDWYDGGCPPGAAPA